MKSNLLNNNKQKKNNLQATKRKPTIRIIPESITDSYKIQVYGFGWGLCPVSLYLDQKRRIEPVRFLTGTGYKAAVKPEEGTFLVLVNISGLKSGTHTMSAVAEHRGKKIEAITEFRLEKFPLLEKDGRPTRRWFKRQEHFLKVRFPNGVNKLPGSRLRALAHRDQVRDKDSDITGPPVNPGCNWYCIGPSVIRKGQVFLTANTYTTAPISGRITSIAIDPHDTNIIYIGAAQGGIWKSIDGGLNWRPKSDYAISLAIGCVTIDASVTDASGKSSRIFAGTGEPNLSDSYYGGGMLFSSNGGESWTARGTTTFARDAFSKIAIDPNNNHHLYACTDVGVYESTDEGVNWNLIESGICDDLVVDWSVPASPKLYVGRNAIGVRRSQNGGATWTTLAGGLPASSGRIALAMYPGNPNILYAAFGNPFSTTNELTGIYRSTDGGNNWTPTSTSPTGVKNSLYNFVLAVHPTNSNIVIFGELHLWRTIDGGTTWTRISPGSPGIHADQHAITFHPTNGNFLYVGNDGGIWYSSNMGTNFTHRNKDLATLQYYGISNHPSWDAVMLGGTQDNGAQRYSGHPAWEHSALGDGAFTAINSTSNTHRWYETRWYSYPCFRNDNSGSPPDSNWLPKQSGISTNGNWFYPPLGIDPNNSSVLYIGYDELWRTSNDGDNWSDITGTLVNANTNITAIAVAPSDSNKLYVGMQDGKMFKVTFSGGAWTATNITSTPLPAGQISDIAVHTRDSNIVYVTTSNLIFSEGAGEFTNDHVFKTTNGGSSWNNISTGLSQANPVNAIVIDPSFPNIIFIGCDVGIFRSDNEGSTWSAWDNGLPNCSVQDLKFFLPNRLLRAATHGRSIWERPVDRSTCPLTDVYMRDDFIDTGIVLPTPSGVEHPFVVGDTVYWYQSVDIKVDSPDPVTNTYQTPTPNIDYIQFEEINHDNPRRQTHVRVYAQVHNRGNNPANNVKVRAFWANAGGGLPNLPSDFWTAFPNTDPGDVSVWHPVGPTRSISKIYPGQPMVVEWTWLVPADAPTHSCMLCIVKSDEDNITTTSISISTAVQNDNNVTLKNLHVDNVVPGATGSSTIGPYFIDFANYDEKQLFDIRFNPGVLPKNTRIRIFFPAFETRLPLEKSLQGIRVLKSRGIRLPERPEEQCGKPTEYNTNNMFMIDIDKLKPHEPAIVHNIVPNGDKFSAAFFIDLPKGLKHGEHYTLHIEHWIANDLIGGSSYELRVLVGPVKLSKR
jgi:photosystem II stability/assembly factor-like uncharacterized protein